MANRLFLLAALLAAGCAAFPASERSQLAMRERQDEPAMRRHGWALLAHVSEGRWRGWHSLAETFGGAAPGAPYPFRAVEVPESGGVALRQASGAPLLSLVLLNPAAFDHVRRAGLFSRARLDAINAGFGTAPPAARQIAPFPRAAMAAKLIFAVVHARGITRLSVWDGPGDPAHGNPPAGWPREVRVDPAGTGATATVPLQRFFHLPIDAAALPAVRAIDPSAALGDHLILLGLHLTTKEIPDWVWTTYWWHDRQEGPFAADRPRGLAGPWRHYLMDVAYSMETPREADGGANIAFNPYIEVFPAGTRSNCAACHQGAVWTPSGAPAFLPVRRGARAETDPLFLSGTRLDFMWSIATEAR